jgi:hypothetical protein
MPVLLRVLQKQRKQHLTFATGKIGVHMNPPPSVLADPEEVTSGLYGEREALI